MNEKDKELKSFNQCADALSQLDKKSILKVFHMLSIHFEVMPSISANISNIDDNANENNDSEKLLPESISKSVKVIAKTNKTEIVKKGKNGTSKGCVYLTDYDFRPHNKTSLKDFYNKYKTTNNLENNLLFIYYFQEELKESPITMNHIYSAYRHINLKLPSFPQTLADTKSRKGWIDANQKDLKVTRNGINYFQHDMKKNDV